MKVNHASIYKYLSLSAWIALAIFTPFLSIQAATSTWIPTSTGTFTWNIGSNWTAGFPNAAGDVAGLTSDLIGDQTVNLQQNITTGTLNIGDSGASPSNKFTISPGIPVTNSLTFAGISGTATAINVSTAGTAAANTIGVGVSLSGSPLTVTANGLQTLVFAVGTLATNGNTLTFDTSNTSGGGGISITGGFTGTGPLVKLGRGNALIQSNATYSGQVTINSGVLAVSGASFGSINSTVITVNGHAEGGIGSGGSLLMIGSNQAAPAGGRLNDSATITLKGGGLSYLRSNAAGITSETIGGIVAGEGNSNITLSPSTGNQAELYMTTLTRFARGTLQVRGAGLGAAPGADTSRIFISTALSLSGGGGATGSKNMSIVPWAIGGIANSNENSGLVTYDATGLRALTASEYNTMAAAGTSDNVADTTVAIASDKTINALRYTAFSGSTNIGAGRTLTLTSGALAFSNNTTAIATGTLNFGSAEGVIFSVSSNTNSISSVINGSGGLTKGGTGTLILSGANTYTGTTTISGGVLRTGAANALPTDTDVFLANTTVNTLTDGFINRVTALDLNGNNITIGSLAGGGSFGGNVLLGSGTLTIGHGRSAIYSGSVGGTGSLVKSGTGSQTLAGASDYSGGTTVTLGSLVVTNTAGSATGTGSVNVMATGSTSFGTLSGGSTAANGGSAAVIAGSGGALGTHAPNVKGIVSGTVTVNQNAHLSPGDNVSTLTLGGLVLKSGSVLDYEFSPTTNDFTAVTGALNLEAGGTFWINLYQAGTTNAFGVAGRYNLLSYGSLTGFEAANFSILNPSAGLSYTVINNAGQNLVQLDIAAVPEPSTLVLMGLGFAVMLFGFRGHRMQPVLTRPEESPHAKGAKDAKEER